MDFDPEYDDDNAELCPQCELYEADIDPNATHDYTLVFRCANCGYSWTETIDPTPPATVELSDF